MCNIKDGSLLDGRTSSVETGFHAGILKARPLVNVGMVPYFAIWLAKSSSTNRLHAAGRMPSLTA